MLKQKQWIEIIVAKTGCTKKEAKMYYDCVFDYMREQINPGQPIKISGFGVLKLRKTAAKEQINLVTGQPEIVPEHNVITFRPYFEIDPKPEPIEVEDEDVVEVNDVAETPLEENVAPEAKVEENVVVEEVSSETNEENDGFVWVYEGNKFATSEIAKVLEEKTQLSVEDINSSLNVVIDNMKKFNQTTCEVKEDQETFDFVIVK